MESNLSGWLFLIGAVLVMVIAIFVASAASRSARSRRETASVISSKLSNGHKVGPKSPKVFVCYRRDDSADVAGRVYDKLVETFGRPHVFKDVDSLRLGRDFRESIDKSVSSCDAFIAIIGRNWLDEVSDGIRRIDDPTDPVRIEIESALARNIPVIPVLVRGSVMPKDTSLPSEIRALAFRHGVPVRRDPDFHTDVDRLIKGLENTFAEDTSLR